MTEPTINVAPAQQAILATSINSPARKRSLVVVSDFPQAENSGAFKLLRDTLLPQAGLDLADFTLVSVFQSAPPAYDIKNWTANKTELKRAGLPAIGEQLYKRYLLPEHQWHLAEFDTRMRELQPELIIALGGTALWAISGSSSIGTYRGNFFLSRYGRAIGIYHPSMVQSQWSYFPIAWADLIKVQKHLTNTLPKPMRRRLWINPTWPEIANVYSTFKRNPHWLLGVDIETSPKNAQITCISFAAAHEGICIPIWDKDAAVGKENYWSTVEEEVKAWRWIDRFAQLPNNKVLQNGLYDMQYLLDAPIEIRLLHVRDDTAILQHSYQPELPKALGVLSSLYLNEPSWKQMRTQDKDENKADD